MLLSGKRPPEQLIDAFFVELTAPSMLAAQDARGQQASGWRTGGLTSTRIRRRRIFKAAARAVRAVKSKDQKETKKAESGNKKVLKARGKLKTAKPLIEAIPANFRRSARGNELIKQEMESLLALDKVKNQKHPAFDSSSGLCRLKSLAMSGSFYDVLCLFHFLFLSYVIICMFLYLSRFAHNLSVFFKSEDTKCGRQDMGHGFGGLSFFLQQQV